MRFTSDGLWYWDGSRWVSALSEDRRFRWNGTKWVTIQTAFVPSDEMVLVDVPAVVATGPRQATSGTLALQRAVAGYFVLTVVLIFVMALLLAAQMSLFFDQSVSPQASSSDVNFAHGLTLFFALVFVGGALMSSSLCVVGIVGSLRRWVWAFYASMVYSALGMAFVPFGLIGLLSAVAQVPNGMSWLALLSNGAQLAYGVASVVVFRRMWSALQSYGPWAMTRSAL